VKVVKGDIVIEGIETIEQLRDVLEAIGQREIVARVEAEFGLKKRLERQLETLNDLSDKLHGIKPVKPNTLRTLKTGAVFKFKTPPPGWSSGWLIAVDKMPGWAAPEGYDYFPMSLLDGEIIYDDGPKCFLENKCQDLDGSGTCKGCGRWLGDKP
jgi:hypothetical protein